MEKKKTKTRILKEEVKDIIFPVEEGYIKGNVRDYDYDILTLDCTEEDIKSALNESIVVRPYFEYKDEKVKIPVFFTCIKGVYNDIGEYLKLMNTCKKSRNNIFVKNVNELLSEKPLMGGIFKNTKIEEVLNERVNININKIKETVGSVFNINEYKYVKYFDKALNKFKVENLIQTGDKGLSKYSVEMQRYLLNKLNSYLNGYYFTTQIEDVEKLKLLECIANLNNEVVGKINNFEISTVSPKITLFLEKANSLSNLDILLLGYFHTLGVDIIVFTPSGVANLDRVLSKNMFSTLPLEKLNNDVSLSLINQINKSLRRFKVNIDELDNSLENLGYNAPIKKYEVEINLFKTPIFRKIGKVIKGWQLTLIGLIGLILDIYLIFSNIIVFGGFSIVLKALLVVLCAIFIFGIKLLTLDM
ncbi:MAG: YceG family protein [Clostridium perfringens]|nr:YceG family protein [Clostridium perfringens]